MWNGSIPPNIHRKEMVDTQLRSRDIRDERILRIMEYLPRERFIPAAENEYACEQAYQDQPLPIGCGQTISQPYMAALMTQSLDVRPEHRILEIGTGYGYQTAILALLAQKVYTLEILEELSRQARANVSDMGIHNVEYYVGDAWLGWPEKIQFDRILVAAVAEQIPAILLDQLAEKGKMVIPLGEADHQTLFLLEKHQRQIKKIFLCHCRFVKLIHKEL